MKLLESGEMYLETILVLTKRNQTVRSIDISRTMNFSKPSVSRAVGKLEEGGYINVDTNGLITLTEKGLSLAESVYEKHVILTEILMSIGVNEKTATDDACRIEHVISEESFMAIKKHFNK
ncbi:MAG: metal-dependent transcriptional regulator [Erysipelotrichaceae bacterium]